MHKLALVSIYYLGFLIILGSLALILQTYQRLFQGFLSQIEKLEMQRQASEIKSLALHADIQDGEIEKLKLQAKLDRRCPTVPPLSPEKETEDPTPIVPATPKPIPSVKPMSEKKTEPEPPFNSKNIYNELIKPPPSLPPVKIPPPPPPPSQMDRN